MENHHWFLSLLLIVFFLGARFIYSLSRTVKKNKLNIQEERTRMGNKFYNSRNEKIDYFVDDMPSKTISFGRKINWLAIKTSDHESVVNYLNTSNKKVFKTNVEHGVHGAYANYMFVFPPIEGWVMVMDIALVMHDKSIIKQVKKLSSQFGEAQAFGNHRVSSFGAWVRCVDGEVQRAYTYADGTLYFNEGDFTAMEDSIYQTALANETDEESLAWLKEEGKYMELSDEENVLAMAGHWSINPDELEGYKITELGSIF